MNHPLRLTVSTFALLSGWLLHGMENSPANPREVGLEHRLPAGPSSDDDGDADYTPGPNETDVKRVASARTAAGLEGENRPADTRIEPAALAAAVAGSGPDQRGPFSVGVQATQDAGAMDRVPSLLARGRSQYLAGDATAARGTFQRVVAIDARNATANDFLRRLADENAADVAGRARTSAGMLAEVNRAWQRPAVRWEETARKEPEAVPPALRQKLDRIVLPSVNFSGMELSRVVNTLSVVSEEFDQTGVAPKGVNIVLLDAGGTNPVVNLTLRNLSLKRVLDFLADSVGYQYEVLADAVILRPGGEQSALETRFYPVSRATVLRLTGRGALSRTVPGPDPLAGGTAAPGPGASLEGEGQAIRSFLQLAGVSFDSVPGSSLAFDGSQLIATQTPRNLERIRNILGRYHEVRQVEIEAKFMEVQQGALEEFGVQWNLAKKSTQHSGATVTDFATANRPLSGAFSSSAGGALGGIIRPADVTVNSDGSTATTDGINLPIINNPPVIPGTNNLGLTASPLASISGILGEFDVSAVVRALSQKNGTELLSAPKLTVLSGNPATITVAQELRYPQSYGQVQSQVGTGSASGGGSAGVAITAGTPQEFTMRNVGVELKVTPTVEEDNYSVSLDLNPKVTEFEGFVEYGGQSVAVAGGTTVTVPSGFFQPIFAVREVTTKVTIWDGATLIMGGLTREDVRQVSDKVPVLGSLPGLGRLFRSRGESTQKRNLLIFVTASLVSPGGARKQPSVPVSHPGALYQNPTVVNPGEP